MTASNIRSAEMEKVGEDIRPPVTIVCSACTLPRQRPVHPAEIYCCLVSFFSIICIIIMFVLGDRMQPIKVLEAQDPEFRVQSAAMYLLNSSSSASDELSATWNLTLLAVNPNKKLDIYYESLLASLFYGPGYQHIEENRQKKKLMVFASRALRPLLLTTGNQTDIRFQLRVVSGYVGEEVAKEISDHNSTAMGLRFGLKVSVWYKYRTMVTGLRESKFVRYYCNRVQVRVFSDYNDSGGGFPPQSTPCEIDGTLSSKFCD